jgi:plasmid stabilization system protein ParE
LTSRAEAPPGPFKVRYAPQAREDLHRLYDFLLDRAQTPEDLEVAERALHAIKHAVQTLARNPFLFRKAGASPFLRELLIDFGRAGYVALFEIEDARTVTILAVRHQSEDDYH